ncbi:hypothetical protein TNCV_3178001 [Trichonephila clavipes]|nr:hypothetical protein TNCV_3178001 [Trichonephila clavipes]
MAAVDFLHHENPSTWAGVEPATLDTELTPAYVFHYPIILAALQKTKVLFSSTNLYVDNIEQMPKQSSGPMVLSDLDTTSSS